MALSSCSARQGLLRAITRSARGVAANPVRRSLTSVPAPPPQLLRRDAMPASCRAWSVLSQQQAQQRRSFAAGSGKEEEEDDDSDDDFKPKRKAVSDDADEVSDLIKKQVCLRVAAPP